MCYVHFWLVVALIRAGRLNEAQTIYEGILARMGPLGLLAEEIEPSNGAQLGNYPLALSHIGLINAAVSFAHFGHTGKIHPQHAAGAKAVEHDLNERTNTHSNGPLQ